MAGIFSILPHATFAMKINSNTVDKDLSDPKKDLASVYSLFPVDRFSSGT